MQNLLDTEVFVATSEHLLFGKIQTAGARLQEIFNDRSSDFVRIRDATVFRGASATIKAAATLTVAKQHVVFAALSRTPYEAPDKRRFAFTDKKQYTCFLLVQGYEIEGKVSLKGSSDPLAALSTEFGDFFPVAQPTIGNIGAQQKVPATVALINKSMISAIEIATPDMKPVAAGISS